MQRIIIDTDPGTDDIFAMVLAIKSEEFKIEGITTVNGNCSLENATNNARYLLEMLKANINVYEGSDKPLKQNDANATNVHGSNGMGGVEIPKIENRSEMVKEKSAIDFLIDTVNNNPNEIVIVAVGPLTNIALAIKKNKDFASNIKKLVVMGGGKNLGNITPYAEFNFYIDPLAADIVLKAKIKEVVIVPLNVTHQNVLNDQRENYLKSVNTKLSNLLYDITRTSAKTYREQGFEGACIHDPVTIAYLIDNNILGLEETNIEIVTSGDRIGQCVFNSEKQPNCKIALEINTQKFYDMFFEKVFKIIH